MLFLMLICSLSTEKRTIRRYWAVVVSNVLLWTKVFPTWKKVDASFRKLGLFTNVSLTVCARCNVAASFKFGPWSTSCFGCEGCKAKSERGNSWHGFMNSNLNIALLQHSPTCTIPLCTLRITTGQNDYKPSWITCSDSLVFVLKEDKKIPTALSCQPSACTHIRLRHQYSFEGPLLSNYQLIDGSTQHYSNLWIFQRWELNGRMSSWDEGKCEVERQLFVWAMVPTRRRGLLPEETLPRYSLCFMSHSRAGKHSDGGGSMWDSTALLYGKQSLAYMGRTLID